MRRLFLLIMLSCSIAAAAENAPGAHPRLLMRAGEEPAAAAGLPLRVDSVIRAYSDAVLDVPPVERSMTGNRLLQTSREVLKRVFWLSWTYRMHGGEIYARRAVEEMLAVSAFSDWNPSHFLDDAEMTMALAIGYDWLYPCMTGDERAVVSGAIMDKGLKAALNDADAWFYRIGNNWNSVCNACMVFGALAVWENDPDFCRAMLGKSLESNKLAYTAYAGGGYPEGYNYWGYSTSFQIMLEVAMEEAFPGWHPQAEGYDDFLASADFIRFTTTPAGNCFSYSDCGRRAVWHYMQSWMAGRRNDPSLLYTENKIVEETGFSRLCEERLLPMYIICADRQRMALDEEVCPDDHYFHAGGTTPVFVYRGGWISPDDDYLGVKGGMSMSSHSHCDQGSFYFESDGVAWATDLGMQSYDSLEKAGVDLWDIIWDGERWQIFLPGPFSHNILTVNGHVPRVDRQVDFSGMWMPDDPLCGGRIGASLDLTALYMEDLDSCSRTVYLQDGDLHVIDAVQAGDSLCTVRWAMCSEAEASLKGDGVLLRSGGHVRMLEAEITGGGEPAAGIWPTTYEAGKDIEGMQHLHPTDAPNPGTALVGYNFILEPHQSAVLHVVLKKIR
ncbi:MAG: heparinase II/III family protein [Bacteroidales bacterium]|nr:heparinase II/III family protein [Bacteroidales bacterium]